MHFHNCLLLLLFTLKWIFSATLIRVRCLPIKGLPTLVLILLLYTALTSKALRSTMISDVLPHPWHPFNGVVLNRTARVYVVGIFTIYLSEYYSHDIVS